MFSIPEGGKRRRRRRLHQKTSPTSQAIPPTLSFSFFPWGIGWEFAAKGKSDTPISANSSQAPPPPLLVWWPAACNQGF